MDESTAAVLKPSGNQSRTGQHLCPWWAGYLLASPLRRLVDKPGRLIKPHVNDGDTVLDIGCAMGYFTIAAARIVGPSGRVVGTDVQERMLRVLQKRARTKGLADIIETRLCTQDDARLADLAGQVDVAILWNVVHESSDPQQLLADCFAALRSGGKLILAEPAGHVSDTDRKYIFDLALDAGFVKREDLKLRKSQGILCEKPR